MFPNSNVYLNPHKLCFLKNLNHIYISPFLIFQILGGLFTPGDGHVDPYSLTQAIASAARKRGAKIFQKAEVTRQFPFNRNKCYERIIYFLNFQVTDVNQLSDGRWEIGTQAGKVTAGRVVNASGGLGMGSFSFLCPLCHFGRKAFKIIGGL